MRHYLALHVWHAQRQNFQQFFMVRVCWPQVLANNFQETFTDFSLYQQTKWWRELHDIIPFSFGLFIVTLVIFQIVLVTI